MLSQAQRQERRMSSMQMMKVQQSMPPCLPQQLQLRRPPQKPRKGRLSSEARLLSSLARCTCCSISARLFLVMGRHLESQRQDLAIGHLYRLQRGQFALLVYQELPILYLSRCSTLRSPFNISWCCKRLSLLHIRASRR